MEPRGDWLRGDASRGSRGRGGDGDGRSSGGAQGGACVPPSLAKQREHYRPSASRLRHLLTSRNSPPFSLSPVSRTLSSSCCLLSFSLAPSHSFSILLSVAPSEPRNSAQVPFLLSRLRFPRPPSFLYTTSFAVVGEGETPAFAVGEAVLFFPLIKADRCGSGCRDDETERGDGGRCTGRVTRGAGR